MRRAGWQAAEHCCERPCGWLLTVSDGQGLGVPIPKDGDDPNLDEPLKRAEDLVPPETARHGGRHDPPLVERPLLDARWWVRRGGASVAVLTVFFVHFRPWQGGLLEDWGLALAWDAEGIGGLWTRLPATLGRPLHLLPHYFGMAVSGGGFVGPYGVLGLVAVAQLVAALWALRPLTGIAALRWAVALALALHPWWAAGDILRFLPAQVSVLGVVVWLGAAVRFLGDGRARWANILVLAPTAGLLTYQAPAAALILGAVVLALRTAATWRRRATLIALTVGVVGVVTAWSTLVAPLLSPSSYESQLLAPSLGLVAPVRAICRTLLLHAPAVVVAVVVVAAIVMALGFDGRLRPVHAWLLLLATASVPLAALAYASTTLHLNDPERVALPVGLATWLVLCSAVPALAADTLARRAATAVLLVATAVGAILGHGTWTHYATEQQELLEAIAPVREDMPPDAQVVVADTTGRFGDVYLLLPPHLNMALDVQYGPGADFVLCTPDGVARDHPSAALYPISTTPDCSALVDEADPESLGELSISGGTFELFEVEP